MYCNRKYIFPSFIYNTLLEHLRPIHIPLQGYDICQEKKNNSAGTSHQGFPWTLLLGFVALKGKKAFIMLVPSSPIKEPLGLLGICHCIHSGILCGLLLLSSSRASTAVFISWYHSNTLSGYLLNLEIPGPPRSPSSEGKFKNHKTLEKQGIPPLLNISTCPDNLQVRRGAPLLTRYFPKLWRESSMKITSTRKQRSCITESCSSCLE